MKLFSTILVFLFLIFASNGSADWIVCDPAPENLDTGNENDVLNVIIIQDGSEIIRQYELTSDSQYVKLVDISLIAQAQFQFMFENKQLRRSNPVDYTLFVRPQGCTGVKIIKND